MNVSQERTRSLWMEVAPLSAPALDREEAADVVVVGAGIAGLSTAYELAARNRSVIVIDRGAIAGGMTARTTAHLASELDDYYFALIDLHGEAAARQHYESQAAAIDRMEAVQASQRIDCDFQRVDGYLFTPEGGDASVLEREYAASQRIGQAVEWADRAPLRGRDTGRCLRFPRQARIHPLKYLQGLAAAVSRLNGRLYADTAFMGVEEKNGTVIVDTANGHKIRAKAAVFATNSPVNDIVAIHTKQAPYRTYAMAGRVPCGLAADALCWDTLDPYHYVRLQPGANEDVLIVGGEDHRSGEADDGDARFAKLEAWARRHVPELGEITHRWSGQVLEPVDYVAFIGRNPGSENVYVATGDSGQGITNGVVASLIVADLITSGENRWAELYDPARKPVGAALEFMRDNAVTVKNLTEYLTGGDVASVEALKPGQGGVVRHGLKKIAAYRDENGALHQRTAVCSHVGCIVHWNSLERCWDCPCHGSQFAPDGAVLNGPAISPLGPAEG